MAKKKGLFGTIAAIGAIAGATAAVYAKRREIRALIEEAAARVRSAEGAQPDEAEVEAEGWEENDDTDIVIDRTSTANEAEETPAE